MRETFKAYHVNFYSAKIIDFGRAALLAGRLIDEETFSRTGSTALSQASSSGGRAFHTTKVGMVPSILPFSSPFGSPIT